MRVRNKEIRARRHRKDQVMKAAARVIRDQYGDKKAATAVKPKGAPAKKSASPKPATERKQSPRS
jgi:hypothetical protein